MPTEIAALHGQPRMRGRKVVAATRAVEPAETKRGDLDAPADLSEAQREIWNHAIANMTPGIIRSIDTQALLAWVLACDLHRQARIQQNRTTLLVNASPRDPNSMPIQSPLLAIINRQAIIMLRAAEQMGFTPTSRPRLAMTARQIPPVVAVGPRVGKQTVTRARRDLMRLEDYIAQGPGNTVN